MHMSVNAISPLLRFLHMLQQNRFNALMLLVGQQEALPLGHMQ